jgi:ATP-dependent exoDNAse (exonuclease V) beta subunit
LSFSLIENLQQESPKAPLPWSGWTRVTPESEGVKINATISGTYFHALMEHLSSMDEPSAQQIESIAYAQGDVVAHPHVLNVFVTEGQRLLKIFHDSTLKGVLRTSKRHLHELPYTLLEEGSATMRRPDLLIETEDGSWLIVDYKTDKFEVSTVAQQALKHRMLKQYVDEFRALTGISAVPCLYFAEHGILHGLPEQSVQLSLLSPVAVS